MIINTILSRSQVVTCIAFFFYAASLPEKCIAAEIKAQANKTQENKTPYIHEADLTFPPQLPENKKFLSEQSAEFLKPTTELKPGVTIARRLRLWISCFIRGKTIWGDHGRIGAMAWRLMENIIQASAII